MMYLAPDVFVIRAPENDAFILYAPLLGVAAQINAELADAVARLKVAPEQCWTLIGSEATNALLQLGLLSQQPFPDLAPDSRAEAFAPTSVSLFLTTACNLGCTYCYASANESPKSLAWPVAKRAIELVFDNARAGKAPSVGITLHGGGEASLEWELVQQIVAYARQKSRAEAIALKLSIGTNGVMPEGRARWLARNLHSATVSLDGSRETHDRNRPTVGGGKSYDVVLRTLRIFDEEGFNYGLRMTVTDDSVQRLSEAVLEICNLLAVRTIQVEPVFPVGRAARNDLAAPEARRFIASYRRAEAIAREHGRKLTYSGARLGTISDRFCGAPGRSFAVTPSGAVSSCYEISEEDDPRANAFFWGQYDAEENAFLLDEERRIAQSTMTVHGKVGCADCFCKWHCAGDCSAKLASLGDARDTSLNPRCVVNRTLTRDQLVRAIRSRPAAELPAVKS
jgi:uncharacterized protein